MANKRFIRNRTRRANAEPFELEMSSLLDILVILLVFLLKNYSVDEFALKINKGISIPDSISKTLTRKGVTIQMSKDFEVFIEEKLITTLENNGEWSDEQDVLIKNELLALKENTEQIEMQSDKASGFNGIINLIMDRELSYEHIDKLMDISADSGYEQFKFIVIES